MGKPVVIRGNAYFTYTDAGGTSYRLNLASPLREITPQFFDRRYRWASADETAFNVISVGSGLHRFTARLRYEGDALALLRMLNAAADDRTPTYVPDADDTRFSYNVKLLNAGELLEAARDPDLWFDGRYETTAVFQRADSPGFDDLKGDVLYGAGGKVFLNDTGNDITLDDATSDTYLNDTGNDITVDGASANKDTDLALYGGSVLTEA